MKQRRKSWMQRTVAERAAIRQLDQSRCHLCGLDIRPSEATHLDHVIPLGAGGTDTPDNMAWAHSSCNLMKHDYSVVSAYMRWLMRREIRIVRGEVVPMMNIGQFYATHER